MVTDIATHMQRKLNKNNGLQHKCDVRDFIAFSFLLVYNLTMNLYMVATPIGNLEDITYRAVRILGEVDVIACEDTRHTMQLLSHYGIMKRLIACHAHNEKESSKGILELLDSGLNVAYCSDAGTPGVSDPGARLCERIIEDGKHRVIPIPGASAVISLVSVAGNIGKSFTFEGFLSPKKGRRTKRLCELFSAGNAFVIYESPFRIIKTLEDIREIAGNATVIAGRELTKAYEEILRGNVDEVLSNLKSRDKVKGEFAVIVIPEAVDDNDKEDPDA